MQHLYKWHSTFKSTADMMLKQFFECKKYCDVFRDYDDCQVWLADMLADCKFVWVVAEKVSFPHHFCVTYEQLLLRI